MLRSLFSSRKSARASATIPAGQRVYAIGDIHGCLDLLDRLLAQIDADDEARGPAETTLIFLGDLVDRGPDSAGVIERLRQLSQARPGVRFLKGNHEEIFLGAIEGEPKALRLFCRIGGRETVLSYGMTAATYESLDYEEFAHRFGDIVPKTHYAFVAGFEDMVTVGDYVFVHAGVRPGVPLDEQRGSDLRWIRDPFLDHRGSLGKTIVHGHTISDEVTTRDHRIGIDTGAYISGRLTALGIEGDQTWTLVAD